ncbi:hypothetical protein GCM10009424_21380 [Sphingomonas ursincola]|uniref:Transposase n=1 Tax=Sphingomonas ursincola TaxID=56361 RepID=A0A7V8RCG2_9SPHN|nr:hypothetical protein [Sphingomonas ursincola]MBA1373894.1 hypothetical protein [Sphingomonas ursincola]
MEIKTFVDDRPPSGHGSNYCQLLQISGEKHITIFEMATKRLTGCRNANCAKSSASKIRIARSPDNKWIAHRYIRTHMFIAQEASNRNRRAAPLKHLATPFHGGIVQIVNQIPNFHHSTNL